MQAILNIFTLSDSQWHTLESLLDIAIWFVCAGLGAWIWFNW